MNVDFEFFCETCHWLLLVQVWLELGISKERAGSQQRRIFTINSTYSFRMVSVLSSDRQLKLNRYLKISHHSCALNCSCRIEHWSWWWHTSAGWSYFIFTIADKSCGVLFGPTWQIISMKSTTPKELVSLILMYSYMMDISSLPWRGCSNLY